MNVFGYGRGDGNSLDEQLRLITAHAAREGWSLTRTFVDEPDCGSIAWAERPAGHELFAELGPGDAVIVAAIDPIFPDLAAAVAAIEDFTARGISLYLLDLGGDVSGKGRFPGNRALVTTILRAFAGRD
jgi:putative DNA-invertase from lambdoid prophage Rac